MSKISIISLIVLFVLAGCSGSQFSAASKNGQANNDTTGANNNNSNSNNNNEVVNNNEEEVVVEGNCIITHCAVDCGGEMRVALKCPDTSGFTKGADSSFQGISKVWRPASLWEGTSFPFFVAAVHDTSVRETSESPNVTLERDDVGNHMCPFKGIFNATIDGVGSVNQELEITANGECVGIANYGDDAL